jgi:hypothetical protein
MKLNVLGQGLNIGTKSINPKIIQYSKDSLDSIKDPYLESLESFQSLVNSLKKFYEEKSNPTARTTKWKELLHNSLHSLLVEATYTNDKSLQLKLLDQINNWYNSKTNKKLPVSTARVPNISSRPISTPNTTSIRPKIETPLIKRKNSTPPPKQTVPTIKTTYQAFVNQKSQETEIDVKLNSIFEAMQKRQEKKINIGKYNQSKV